MELVTKKRLMLFAGSGNPELSEEIASALKLPLGDIKLSRFANGELYCRYGESVRGADVHSLTTFSKNTAPCSAAVSAPSDWAIGIQQLGRMHCQRLHGRQRFLLK